MSPPNESRESLLVLGTGSHAKVVIEILEAIARYEIVGVVSGDPEPPRALCGYPFLGDWGSLSQLHAEGITHAAVGVGGLTDNDLRREVYDRARSVGFELVSPLHPSAIVATGVAIGEATVVDSGAILATGVKVGRNVIVACGAVVNHESVLEDHTLVSSGVVVGGRVRVGEGAVLGISCTVATDCTVGARSVVGAGALALADVPPETTVVGVPAYPHVKRGPEKN